MFTNGRCIGLPIRAWVEKTVYGVPTHKLYSKVKVPGAVVRKQTYKLSDKEKVPDAVFSKVGNADSDLGQEMTHNYWFLWKRSNYL